MHCGSIGTQRSPGNSSSGFALVVRGTKEQQQQQHIVQQWTVEPLVSLCINVEGTSHPWIIDFEVFSQPVDAHNCIWPSTQLTNRNGNSTIMACRPRAALKTISGCDLGIHRTPAHLLGCKSKQVNLLEPFKFWQQPQIINTSDSTRSNIRMWSGSRSVNGATC